MERRFLMNSRVITAKTFDKRVKIKDFSGNHAKKGFW